MVTALKRKSQNSIPMHMIQLPGDWLINCLEILALLCMEQCYCNIWRYAYHINLLYWADELQPNQQAHRQPQPPSCLSSPVGALALSSPAQKHGQWWSTQCSWSWLEVHWFPRHRHLHRVQDTLCQWTLKNKAIPQYNSSIWYQYTYIIASVNLAQVNSNYF